MVDSRSGESNVDGECWWVMVRSEAALALRVVLHHKVHDGTTLSWQNNNRNQTLNNSVSLSIQHLEYAFYIYCISSKSRRTLKSCRPRNLAASICQLVPINAALEISPHGKGSTTISVCARAFCVHSYIGLLLKLCTRVRVDLCRRRPRIVAAPNGALK